MISRLKDNMRRGLVLLGDFNGHIGKDLLNRYSTRLIGNNLYHERTNESGEMLFHFASQQQLVLSITFGRNSAKVTRRIS